MPSHLPGGPARRRLAVAVLAASLAVSFVLPASAQGGPGAADPSSLPPEASAGLDTLTVPELRTEFEDLQGKISVLQEQALQDTTLQQELASLEAAVEEEMAEIDPETPDRQAQMLELRGQLEAADKAGEQEQLMTLLEEGKRLQTVDRQVRMEALQSDAILPKIEAFQENVLTAMTALDPEARKMVDRATAIANRLSEGP
jgi:hypothetical protein